ncbi:unnamed protein product [Rotaria sp. Silwood2]|nr:unnamed protein product [Rotaria sp. Silwood2]CAF4454141.1 unnamed protein product [Rotaria sp. Silwood2]
MSKNIRRKIIRAIQRTFRLSSSKSSEYFIIIFHINNFIAEIICCDAIKKPNDYADISYPSQQKSTKNDYIDLSECYSWPSFYSKDSGISSTTSVNKNCYELESTRIFSDDSSSFSISSNLSSISHFDINIARNTIPTSFQCCYCHCHQYVNNDILFNQIDNYLYPRKQDQQRLIKNKIYPFIF